MDDCVNKGMGDPRKILKNLVKLIGKADIKGLEHDDMDSLPYFDEIELAALELEAATGSDKE